MRVIAASQSCRVPEMVGAKGDFRHFRCSWQHLTRPAQSRRFSLSMGADTLVVYVVQDEW